MTEDFLAEIDAVHDWAWSKYNITVSSLPDCEHNRQWRAYHQEARRMQLAMIRVKDKAIAGKLPKMHPNSKNVVVPATYRMTRDIFIMHFNKRHKGSLAGGLTALPPDMPFDIEQLYRSFHRRLHATRIDLEHVHKPDPPEANVENAIYYLMENHQRGWFELAGIDGQVGLFPSNAPRMRLATKINGNIQYHSKIEDAADMLIRRVRKAAG